jgi:hypothetical protein
LRKSGAGEGVSVKKKRRKSAPELERLLNLLDVISLSVNATKLIEQSTLPRGLLHLLSARMADLSVDLDRFLDRGLTVLDGGKGDTRGGEKARDEEGGFDRLTGTGALVGSCARCGVADEEDRAVADDGDLREGEDAPYGGLLDGLRREGGLGSSWCGREQRRGESAEWKREKGRKRGYAPRAEPYTHR